MLGTVGTSVILQASRTARRRAPLLAAAFTHAFGFRAPGELLFGAALLYFYRLFERQWGSRKYGSFVAVTCGLAYALEAAAAAAQGGRSPAAAAASGPYLLIFANLATNFVSLVPPLHQFTVFGLKMTDKASAGWGVGVGAGAGWQLRGLCRMPRRIGGPPRRRPPPSCGAWSRRLVRW